MKLEENLTHALISAHHTEFWLRQIPARQNIKNLLNRTIQALIPLSKMVDGLDEAETQTYEDIYNNHIDLINEVVSVPLYEASELNAVIKAFKKDKKSLLGISKKILK